MAKKSPVITEQMVDELAQVRQQLAELVAREKALKETFREAGAAVYRGQQFQVEITFSSQSRLDSQAVKDALGPKWIAEHQKAVEQMNIRSMVLV